MCSVAVQGPEEGCQGSDSVIGYLSSDINNSVIGVGDFFGGSFSCGYLPDGLRTDTVQP